MIQTKLINILKQLPKTSAKETEKIVNLQETTVTKIVNEFETSTRAATGDQSNSIINLTEEDSSDAQVDETSKTTFKDSAVFDKKDKRFTYKDKDRKNKDKKDKSLAISKPTPTAPEYAMYLQYNKKGIFFKTNLKDLNNRDKNGSVIINIGDE
tara:strand:- start:148 stop:609 length:462 start_codon:yes stop_codon:yes gene_type:complete